MISLAMITGNFPTKCKKQQQYVYLFHNDPSVGRNCIYARQQCLETQLRAVHNIPEGKQIYFKVTVNNYYFYYSYHIIMSG